MAAIMEVSESMRKSFLQFEPAPRRGEPEVLVNLILAVAVTCSGPTAPSGCSPNSNRVCAYGTHVCAQTQMLTKPALTRMTPVTLNLAMLTSACGTSRMKL